MKSLITSGVGMPAQKLVARKTKVGSIDGKPIEAIIVVDAYKQAVLVDGFKFRITSHQLIVLHIEDELVGTIPGLAK